MLDAPPWAGGRPTGEILPIDALQPLCPVEPSKILGIGRNYRDHAAEMGGEVPREPLVFLKPPSSLLATGGTVLLPPESHRVDYEGELGVVIGKRCRRITAEHALDHVFGYTIVCDVTARDLQSRDGQWARAKGFDTFCPVGPTVVSGIPPHELDITVRVGGAVRQAGNTRDMIFDVPALIAHLSAAMTLVPGDLVTTGTPAGVGPLAAGDRVSVEVSAIGTLAFDVQPEPSGAASA